MKTGIIKKRLKEVFGSDVQEKVAAKLGMSQPNVSKMLTGLQLPTAEVLKNISKVYDVSVDWLLGLSDDRHLRRRSNAPTYGDAVKILLDLEACGAISIFMGSDGNLNLKMKDPLLRLLLKKGEGLKKADCDSYQDWREKRLNKFSDKDVINGNVWMEIIDLGSYLKEAGNGGDLTELYQMAIERQKEFEPTPEPDLGSFDK